MAKNNIELAIGSKFDGEGFRKLDTAMRSSSGNVRKVGSAVGQMLQTMDGLDGSVGKVARTAGGLVGGFLSMGVWGIAIAGVTKLVGWLMKLKDQMHDARLAAKGLSKEFMTLEHQARGYQKRVEQWKQAKAEKDAAEEKAALAAKKAHEAELKAIDERTQAEKEYDEYLMKTAALKEKIAGLSDDQIAVNNAQRQVAFANKWGGNYDRTEAELNLELAKKRQADLIDKAADEMLAELDAIDEAEKAEREKAEAAKKAAKKEAEITKLKEAEAKKVAELDAKIAAARQEAARLEENAARARGGKSFNEWDREERQLAKDQAKAERRQKKAIDSAIAERDRLMDDKRRFGKGFSPIHEARLKKLNEFIADQNPQNNPALKAAEQLEKEKRDLMAKTQRDIADIAAALNAGVTA